MPPLWTASAAAEEKLDRAVLAAALAAMATVFDGVADEVAREGGFKGGRAEAEAAAAEMADDGQLHPIAVGLRRLLAAVDADPACAAMLTVRDARHATTNVSRAAEPHAKAGDGATVVSAVAQRAVPEPEPDGTGAEEGEPPATAALRAELGEADRTGSVPRTPRLFCCRADIADRIPTAVA